MKKWKERWNEMLSYEKIFEIATYVFFAVFLGVVFSEFLFAIGIQGGVLEKSFNAKALGTGLLTVVAGCQAVVYWRRKRNSAIFYLAIAIIWGLDTIWEIVKLFF